jgi:protein-S-isoprenylcysteine O-methyltransferase Ste14
MVDSSAPKPADQAGVRVPPPLIYAGVFGAGLLLQQLFPVQLQLLYLTMSHVVAFVCMSIAAILGVWGLVCFRLARTNPIPDKPSTVLVIVGPYRLTRNPMYVSLIFLYMGLALRFDVIWALVLLPLLVAIIRYYVIAKEEGYLERKFGQEYLDYKARVRRWL